MVQLYKPRQIRGGDNAGKWHYTVGSDEDGATYPIGACADGCPGHDTAHLAVVHFAESLADGEIRERDDDFRMKKCIVCDTWTQHFAMLWEDPFAKDLPVCSTHDIRVALRAELFKRFEVTEGG